MVCTRDDQERCHGDDNDNDHIDGDPVCVRGETNDGTAEEAFNTQGRLTLASTTAFRRQQSLASCLQARARNKNKQGDRSNKTGDDPVSEEMPVTIQVYGGPSDFAAISLRTLQA